MRIAPLGSRAYFRRHLTFGISLLAPLVNTSSWAGGLLLHVVVTLRRSTVSGRHIDRTMLHAHPVSMLTAFRRAERRTCPRPRGPEQTWDYEYLPASCADRHDNGMKGTASRGITVMFSQSFASSWRRNDDHRDDLSSFTAGGRRVPGARFRARRLPAMWIPGRRALRHPRRGPAPDRSGPRELHRASFSRGLIADRKEYGIHDGSR